MTSYVVYCKNDVFQTYQLYQWYQWNEVLESFYHAHGNGD